jgi:hypothetical protein
MICRMKTAAQGLIGVAILTVAIVAVISEQVPAASTSLTTTAKGLIGKKG